ncbi:hypothetical protein MTR_3g051170 [Medicago truncatula]|uniref:Uncharacterized protein n=1 Tax=Medicago truncatula TaxID=3880 RepID=G7IXK0_MEDTR|nr:hypothetical protein MTR_3g051170 [Medicago truncatula]
MLIFFFCILEFVLRQQPDHVHQFYSDSDSSSTIRVDGDYTETASDSLIITKIAGNYYYYY